MVSAASVLPQARIFPFGNRFMWSGTTSHATTGPHWPLLASGGSADTSTGDEVTLASPAVNSSACEPMPRRPRSRNRALPFASVVAVMVPSRVPERAVAVTSTPATGLPALVTNRTGCASGSNTSPSTAPTGGLVVIAIASPGPPPVSVAVAANVTGEPSRPLTVAVVVCSPGSGPRTRVTEARPSELVSTELVETVPPPCAAHETPTPSTGSPFWSVTSTTSGLGQRLPHDRRLIVPVHHLDPGGNRRLSAAVVAAAKRTGGEEERESEVAEPGTTHGSSSRMFRPAAESPRRGTANRYAPFGPRREPWGWLLNYEEICTYCAGAAPLRRPRHGRLTVSRKPGQRPRHTPPGL